MKKGKTTVEQGQVTVNSVDMVAWGRNFRIFEIDTRHKYPELICYGGNSVDLMMSEHTPLHHREGREELPTTRITFDVPQGWERLHEHRGRYSMRFGFYKPRRKRKLLWWREDKTVVEAVRKERGWQ
jgi:hypothetical protein